MNISDMWLCWLKGEKSESMEIRERLEGKFFVSYISAKPFYYSCKRIMPLLGSQTHSSIVAEIQIATSFLWVYSEVKYHIFISSYSANELSFGHRIAGNVMWDCAFPGAFRSTIRLTGGRGCWSLYIHQVGNTNERYVLWIVLCLNLII
jgi:hypothetical protein